MKPSFTLDDEAMATLCALKVIGGHASLADALGQAVSLYVWLTRKTSAGKTIAVIDGDSVREYKMPWQAD